MNNKNFYFVAGVLLLPVLMNLLLSHKVRVNNEKFYSEKQTINSNWSSRIHYLKRNLFLNYKFTDVEIEKQLVTSENVPIDIVLNDASYVVLFYPTDVCEVCEEEMFKILAQYTQDYPEKFIAIIPEINYASFKNRNYEYNLKIQHIFPYSSEMLPFFSEYRKAVFFNLNSFSIATNFYIPSKPLDSNELSEYLELAIN